MQSAPLGGWNCAEISCCLLLCNEEEKRRKINSKDHSWLSLESVKRIRREKMKLKSTFSVTIWFHTRIAKGKIILIAKFHRGRFFFSLCDILDDNCSIFFHMKRTIPAVCDFLKIPSTMRITSHLFHCTFVTPRIFFRALYQTINFSILLLNVAWSRKSIGTCVSEFRYFKFQ